MRTLTLLAASMLLASSVNAQSMAGKPFLSVQGHAETRVKPDIFPLEVTIANTGMDAARSQRLVEDLSRRVLSEAALLKLVDADIEVGNISISPKTKWDEDGEEETFLGNEYERVIRLRFRSLDALRKFISAMPDSRDLRLETESFEYSKAQELKRRLRREAIEDAKQGAAEMASAVGKRLVELQNVSDRAQSTVYSASGYSRDSTALLAPGTVTVQGGQSRSPEIVLREGEIKVSADAFLVYVIGD